MTQKSDLPFGSEFSPSQIELRALLDLAVAHEGNVKTLQAAIQAQFFSTHGAGNAKIQSTLAMNCRLGMKAYGLPVCGRKRQAGQKRYANKVMADSNLCILLIDRTDLNAIRDNPARIVDAQLPY
jgi:hypothetical protein